ncbi:MAG: hypothetical protein RLN70_12735, partial [Rhodospirillaceae bacterium]
MFDRFRARFARALADDSGVAVLAIAAAIMVVAGSATAVFLSSVASPVVQDLKSSRSGNTHLGLIHEALQAAALQDTDLLLPCPADPTDTGGTFGTAPAHTGNGCAVNRGIVPFRTLGLSEDSARDGEGNYITYLVDDDNVSICDGKYPNSGDLVDQQDSASYLFALIS